MLQINKPTPKFTSLTPSQPLENVTVGEPERNTESVLVLNLYLERLSDVAVVDKYTAPPAFDAVLLVKVTYDAVAITPPVKYSAPPWYAPVLLVNCVLVRVSVEDVPVAKIPVPWYAPMLFATTQPERLSTVEADA